MVASHPLRSAALALLALLLLAGPAGAVETHLLAVGHNLGRVDEAPLRHAERDAARFVEVMRRLGNVRPQDAVLVQGVDADSLRQTFTDVHARLAARAAAGVETALVFYYSGHADANGLHLGESTLDYDGLKAMVNATDAKVRVLILDGCKSGGLTRVKGVSAGASFSIAVSESLDAEGTVVMTSSAAGEDSYESERLGGSFFSHHLFAALRGAGDRDDDGRVTLSEAYAYAYDNTLRDSQRTPKLQHPTYSYDIKGRGDLVMTTLRPDRVGRLRTADEALYIVRDASAQGPVRATARTERPGTVIALPPGRYFVQERHPDHYREYRVELEQGRDVALDQQPYRRVAYARLVRKGAGVGFSQSLFVQAIAHGSVTGHPWPTPGVGLVYGLDLPWATFSLRGRYGRRVDDLGDTPTTLQWFGGGVGVERVADFGWGSLSVGLFGETVAYTQTFELADAPDRRGVGASFGGSLAVEVPLSDAWSVRLDGGPVTHLLEAAEVDNGAVVGQGFDSRFSWWGALGAGTRF